MSPLARRLTPKSLVARSTWAWPRRPAPLVRSPISNRPPKRQRSGWGTGEDRTRMAAMAPALSVRAYGPETTSTPSISLGSMWLSSKSMRAGPAAKVRVPSTTIASCVSRRPRTTGSKFAPPRRTRRTYGASRRLATSPGLAGRKDWTPSLATAATDSEEARTDSVSRIGASANRTVTDSRPSNATDPGWKPAKPTSMVVPPDSNEASPAPSVRSRATVSPASFRRTTLAPGTTPPIRSKTRTYTSATPSSRRRRDSSQEVLSSNPPYPKTAHEGTALSIGTTPAGAAPSTTTATQLVSEDGLRWG